MDELLAVNLDDNLGTLCKNKSNSPVLYLKPTGNGIRFFDRSSDSAFSSQYDSSPRSSTGSSNPSDKSNLASQVPIIIGDRVFVGPSRLTGTVAYMGPTHFAAGDMVGVVLDSPKGKHDGTAYGIRYFQCPPRCGMFCRLHNLKHMDAAKHSPNCRIRTESISNPSYPHTNGLDYRRFSLTNSNHLPRSSSARFARRNIPFLSVIGAFNPSMHGTPTHFKRSKSDRFKSSRPQWKPPGSPTASTVSQPKSKYLNRSQTLPRSTKRGNLLVSFDLNACHDLIENSSVVSCPSLRPALKTTPKASKARSTTNLLIVDHRKPSALQKPQRLSRSRTWSPDRLGNNGQRSRSAGSSSCQRIDRAPDNYKAPSYQSSFALSHSTPKSSDSSSASNFVPCFSKSLSADIVIECAQDRLVELQNQVVEAYRARAEVTQALDEQRRRYKELARIYEDFRIGALRKPKSRVLPSTHQLDKMQAELTNEYERTKHLLFELKRLTLDLNEHSVAKLGQTDQSKASVQQSTPFFESSNSKLTPIAKNRQLLNAIVEQETEGQNELETPTQIEVTVTSPERVDCQIERLRINSAHQRQCDKLLCKMIVCRESIKNKLTELQESQLQTDQEQSNEREERCEPVHSENSVDQEQQQQHQLVSQALSVLETVINSQAGLVEREKGKCRQLSVELSVIHAEISHLTNGPVVEAQKALQKLTEVKSSSQNAIYQIGELQDCNSALRHTVDTAKLRMENDNHDPIGYLRNSLRIHQLKQMEYKAKLLCDEQTVLIRTKSEELAKIVNELNLVSQLWANERELKLYTNQQLKERLAQLTGTESSTHSVAPLARTHPDWKSRPNLNGPDPSSVHGDQSTLVYSLFGALCKEIRRLQTRSANLVDALNSLNTGKCSSSQLAQIKMLVHRSSSSAPTAKSNRSFTRRDHRRLKSRNEFTHELNRKHLPNDIPITRLSYSFNPTNELDCAGVEDRSKFEQSRTESISSHGPSGMRQRRRRPASFYLRRTFEPVLEDTITEVDEEFAESP